MGSDVPNPAKSGQSTRYARPSYLRSAAKIAQAPFVTHPHDDDEHALEGPDDDEYEDDDGGAVEGLGAQLAGLEGLPIGPPFAMATDCALLPPNPQRKVEGCIACIQCDACGQQFRVNLLGTALHACPKCKLEYTSVLIVATSDDDQILGDAFRTVLRSNGLLGANPDDEEEEDDDDEPGGTNDPRTHP